MKENTGLTSRLCPVFIYLKSVGVNRENRWSIRGNSGKRH